MSPVRFIASSVAVAAIIFPLLLWTVLGTFLSVMR